ncbi:hypothetical protein [Hymenobacter terricola]|uniref:hypothetical protein n=1 Tax=Hymenobacter terricola TaxID=2819236 RepID=UPI001CF2539D|nr:hypothetical protein [Hymenobacter terricola]
MSIPLTPRQLLSMKKYVVNRKCTDCGFEVNAPLTKREAAFELFDATELFGPTCVVCGGSKSTGSFTMPMLDEELITAWAQDEGLFVERQDEELILAEGRYLEMILGALDSPLTLLHKKHVLLSALCVIIYDNAVVDGKEWKPNNSLKQRAIDELNKRKELLAQAGDSIMDYIQKVVYPQLSKD